jgi:hypothetical protein
MKRKILRTTKLHVSSFRFPVIVSQSTYNLEPAT